MSTEKSCAALRRRATYNVTDLFTLSHVKAELIKLPAYTKELQCHLADITSELTPATQTYLKLLACLSSQKWKYIDISVILYQHWDSDENCSWYMRNIYFCWRHLQIFMMELKLNLRLCTVSPCPVMNEWCLQELSM